MRLALEQARLAASLGEVPVGAVLVSGDGEVGRDSCVHNILCLRASGCICVCVCACSP